MRKPVGAVAGAVRKGVDTFCLSLPSRNRKGNENGHSCSTNEKNFAGHIWDYSDADGRMGATATVVVNSFVRYYEETSDWQAMAWWIHDHLDYSDMEFFPKLAAFNLQWRQEPRQSIYSFIPPNKGWLTKPGMPNHSGDHSAAYSGWLASRPA